MVPFLILSLLFGAEAKITAPEFASAGKFILIDGADSTGTLTWAVADREVSVFVAPDSKQIVVYSPTPRFCKIRLTATDMAGHSADVAIIEFTADSHHPAPAPGPKPDPKPNPKPPQPSPPQPGKTLPAGRFGISQETHDRVLEVETPDRKTETARVIAALETLQAEFKTDRINPKSPLQISGAINKACQALPSEQQKRWLPTFGTWWTTRLRDLWDQGQLNTKEDWTQLIEETLIGLRA